MYGGACDVIVIIIGNGDGKPGFKSCMRLLTFHIILIPQKRAQSALLFIPSGDGKLNWNLLNFV